MRRVVVTGIGIVSSIGNNADEVPASLREARSGVTAAPEYAEMGFRCQVHARPDIDWESMIDRRAARFLAPVAAYAHIAMEQAIADSGLGETEVSNDRTGLVVGAGGPSTRAIVEAGWTSPAPWASSASGPSAVPKGMKASRPSATLSTWFKIRGLNFSISSACATSTHCIGRRGGRRRIAFGKQDMMFAGGCERRSTGRCRRCSSAMGAMSTEFNACPAKASRAWRQSTATAS